MANEMIEKALSAEKEAGKILAAAHAEANVILEKARLDAAELRSQMLERASAEATASANEVEERSQYAVVEAVKRSEIEGERLRNALAEKRTEVVSALVRAITN